MIERRDKLDKQFKAFRGKLAQKEKGYFEIVLKFNQFMEDYSAHPIPLTALRHELISSKDITQKLGDGGYNRALGAMAAVKFSIDDALEVLSGPRDSPLKQQLATLGELLAVMYAKPLDNTVANKSILLALMKELLQLDIENAHDALVVKDICLRAFVLLSTLERSLSKLSRLGKFGVEKATRLKVEDLLADINQMLKELEAKIEQLKESQANNASVEDLEEEVLQPSAQSSQNEPSPSERLQALPVKKTVKDQAVIILKEKAGDRIDLTQVADSLGVLKMDVASVLRLKSEQSKIIDDIRTLQVLSRDLALNKEKIKGVLYVHELVERHRDALKLLGNLSQGDPNFQKLNENLFKIEHPDLARYLISKGLWVLSGIGSLSNMAYRAAAPKKVKEVVEAIAPETLDSQSKKLLEKVVMDRLIELNQQLVRVQKELPQIPNQEVISVEFHNLVLAQETAVLQEQSSALEFLHREVQSVVEVEKRYSELCARALKRVVEDPQILHPLQISLLGEMKAICLEILVQKRKSEDQKLNELQLQLRKLSVGLNALVAKRKDMEAKKKEFDQELGQFKAGLFDNFNVTFLTRRNELLEEKLKAAQLADEAYARELSDFESSFPTLKDLTQRESVDELEQVLQAHALVQQAVSHYVDVRKDIKLIDELKSSKDQMAAFVLENAVTSTYFWNYLVELFTGKKSKTVQMIEEAQKLNGQIEQFKKDLERNAVEANEQVKGHFPTLQLPVEASKSSDDKPKQETPGQVEKLRAQQILSHSKFFLAQIKGGDSDGAPSPDESNLNVH
ncbi:hypothetical protein [Legionella waltersii]|uniref:Purine NTPase n=1 Tax=Legionella waltersii TaxID=66969 RepID=A0A0W1A007_9GAMM|nr:hypothetical protein [Legionella waltersii]KTD74660.1 purine NTPase [Legionella waltersii]SNV09088.1 purine NTPase, putative [Legionella waltersii]